MKFLHSVKFKIILTFCLICLTTSILIVYLSIQVQKIYEQRLMDSYENQLAIGMNQFDSDIEYMKQDALDLLKENWPELSMGNGNAKVGLENYTFWKELKAVRENYDFCEAAYMKSVVNDYVSYTYNRKLSTDKQADTIKENLNKQDMSNIPVQKIFALDISGREYFIFNIKYIQLSYGFLVPIDYWIKGFIQENDAGENQFYCVDAEGSIVSNENQFKIELNSGYQNLLVDGEKQKVVVIYRKSSAMDYGIVRIIPVNEFNAANPFIKKMMWLLAAVCMVFIPIMWLVIEMEVVKPIHRIDYAMKEAENGNWNFALEKKRTSVEFEHIEAVYNQMNQNIKQLTVERYEKEIEKLQIEATNTKLQANPHMLLNSLNIIYSLSQTNDNAAIQEFTQYMVEYIRYAIRNNSIMVKLKEEMQFVDVYIKMQKIRFEDAFIYSYSMEEELEDTLVPSFIVQEFVENVFKYGLILGELIEIIVIIGKRNDRLTISICDTGNGMSEEILKTIRGGEPIHNQTGKHIGIWNCRRRLKMLYDDEAVLHVSSAPGEGTQIWMEIPFHGGKE